MHQGWTHLYLAFMKPYKQLNETLQTEGWNRQIEKVKIDNHQKCHSTLMEYFIWSFHGGSFSTLLTCSNDTTGDDSLCSTLTKYNKTTRTALGNTSQSPVVVCVWGASPSAFLSVHRERDKWPCQSLMKRRDCSARHRAVISPRNTDSPKEKSSFNQARLIWDKDERCLSGEGKNLTWDNILLLLSLLVLLQITVKGDWLSFKIWDCAFDYRHNMWIFRDKTTCRKYFMMKSVKL